MLHLLYILAFTVIAILAVANLFRSLFTLGAESQRSYSRPTGYKPTYPYLSETHPELLDESGHLTKEPLLVMRSFTVEDAREQLDALYNASEGDEARGEA